MNDELERMLSTPPRLRLGPGPHLVAEPRGLPRHTITAPADAMGPDSPLADDALPGDEPADDLGLVQAPCPAYDPPPTPYAAPLVEAAHLKKSYRKGRIEVPVLRDVSLSVAPGEFLAIVGQSGSGKSTLLHLLGTLDSPDRGEIRFQGRRIENLPAAGLAALRNKQFGMIFQFYHLLPELTTLQNVLAPLMIAESSWRYFLHRHRHRTAATEMLRLVGLEHRLRHKPAELSGGEMQRAAIARALIARPQLLLADEPTGNLDFGTGEEIMKILRTLNRQQNLTIVMVTHDQAIAKQADRIVRLADGRIE